MGFVRGVLMGMASSRGLQAKAFITFFVSQSGKIVRLDCSVARQQLCNVPRGLGLALGRPSIQSILSISTYGPIPFDLKSRTMNALKPNWRSHQRHPYSTASPTHESTVPLYFIVEPVKFFQGQPYGVKVERVPTEDNSMMVLETSAGKSLSFKDPT
ncbi:hypothetical protein OIU74_012385 [Salix koriyanagi]|uniref:Uncharacterized protein n=1 Tax=Salix koriyanagi TaxID=2511006 RepID=A0A9Q0T585_9ROSI|nr:hypothetical protein OIU74_012385 [Salix koriyanagi]